MYPIPSPPQSLEASNHYEIGPSSPSRVIPTIPRADSVVQPADKESALLEQLSNIGIEKIPQDQLKYCNCNDSLHGHVPMQ